MGKEKIDHYFQEKIKKNYHLFVPYIVAGDGGLDILNDRIEFLQENGAAAIELGIPFSDPVADGPTIQEASTRALENETTLAKVLETLEPNKTKRHIPVIIMTYLNPVFAFGIEYFAAECDRVGVDGVIIPDIPLEEEEVIANSLNKYNIAFIRLVALTSTPERMRELAKRSEGFLYAVSVTGTTGVRAAHQKRVYAYLQKLKEYSNVPVLAGFGVSNPEQAKELSKYCDGVIVGSKIVDLLHQGRDNEVKHLIKNSL